MSKKRLIPFRLFPGSWGLKGRAFDIAEAEYNLSGYELAVRRNEILEEDPVKQQVNLIKINQQYKKISDYDADVAIAKLTLTDTELDIALLEIDRKYLKVDKTEYDKKLATLKQEPWVAMPNLSWDPNDPNKSYFELDFNEHFVTYLKSHGYTGITDELVVEKWLNDVCRSVAAEMAIDDAAPFVSNAVGATKRTRKGKRKSEYS